MVKGKVTKAIGLLIEGRGIWAQVGAQAIIHPLDVSLPVVNAEVVGFHENKLFLMPLEGILGIGPESRIEIGTERHVVPVGSGMLGRVIDGLGCPIDHQGPLDVVEQYPLYRKPINPLARQRITTPLDVGVSALNGLLTCGRGQRVGVFAGSGIGKSTLLGMVARNTSADVNVIALIGERGREVKEFIEANLGQEGLKRSVVVVSTSDHPPLMRKRGAFLAITIAEYFRNQGKEVLFLMDSITRFAMAQREIGLAIGEPPATKGYPPSVFAMLPVFLERAGSSDHRGSITGIYTILVEGDDMSDPIADTVRSILDGHIVLSRELACQGHYPPIDILQSTSRVMPSVVTPEHLAAAVRFKALLSAYRRTSDLIAIGAYKEGSDPEVDLAIRMKPKMDTFLCQDAWNGAPYEDTLVQLFKLFEKHT
jgi:flagellum-specific ATP synthase